jgi:hypothetical protein
VAIGVYPGSFNPPTIAHLAIARAAVEQCQLERVDLVLSRDALGKVDADLVPIDARFAVLQDIAASRPWLGACVTDLRFIADIAEEYDVLVVGADKWAQIVDPIWYGDSEDARDAVVARLPLVACSPRPPFEMPDGCVALDVHPDHHVVSATDVRAGRREWMAPEAIAFDDATGAWSGAG